MLVTKRLELHEVRLEHKAAFHQGAEALSQLLGVAVPPEWPEFPEAFTLPANDVVAVGDTGSNRWPGYLFIDRSKRALVGNGGYAGEPDGTGEVEVGYEVAPDYRNLGYASEAVRALVDHALKVPEVTAVIAHTLAVENASVRVLRKVGFQWAGELVSEDADPIWRWQITRKEIYQS
ncbi:MAG: GNAT family N-acetyltransferase [Anaerolineales bacterium]|nr:GNAT family N-acetyltransferase [Anaerolineales bacterium]